MDKAPNPIPPSNSEPIEAQNQNPDGLQSTPEGSLSPERIKAIEKALGHDSLVFTTMNPEDFKNLVAEAVDLKTKEYLDDHRKLRIATKVPIVGSVIKATIAASRRADVMDTVRAQGDFSEATFEKLGLDSSRFNTVNSTNADASIERAQHILEHGYRDENGVVTSKLDASERVKEMNAESSSKVRGVLNDYFKALKQAQGEEAKEKIRQEYEAKLPELLGQGPSSKGERVASTIIGDVTKHDSLSIESVKRAMAGVEQAAELTDVTAQQFEEYTEKHLSLYSATMKEGVNTRKKVDGIASAVVAGGVAGAALYVATGRGARTKIRAFLHTNLAMGEAAAGGVTAGLTGAIVGGVFGAVRGAQKANVKLSDAEIKDIANLGEDSASATAEASPATPDKPKGFKQNAAALFGKIEGLKRKATKEETTLARINELRDRKTAEALIQELDMAMSDVATKELLEGDGKEALEKAYANVIARARFSSEKGVDLIKYGDDKGKLEQKLLEVEGAIYSDAEGDDRKAIDERIASFVAADTKTLTENSIEIRKLRAQFMARSAAVEAIAGAAIGAAAGGVFHAVAPHVHALAEKFMSLPVPAVAAVKASDVFEEGIREEGAIPAAEASSDVFEEGGIQEAGEFPAATTAEVVTSPEPLGTAGKTIEGVAEQINDNVNTALSSENADAFVDSQGNSHISLNGQDHTYDFKPDGTLTEESKSALEQAKLEVREFIYKYNLDGHGVTQVNSADFFNPDNAADYDLTTVEGVRYDGDNSFVLQGTSVDGEGNIILNASGGNFEGKQILFSLTPQAGAAESSFTGLALDVNPDGTVNLEGTAAESLFDENGDLKAGFRYQLIENNGDSTTIYRSVVGNSALGDNSIIEVPVENPSGSVNVSTVEGEDGVVHNITQKANYLRSYIEAKNGELTNKFGIESNGSSGTFEIPRSGVSLNGGAVSVNRIVHYGGYDPDYDAYFGPKVDPNNLGQSLAQTMLSKNGTDISNLSAPEIEAEFLNQLNSGAIDKGEAIETYFRTLTNSPESMVLNRFLTDESFYTEVDLDGDGVVTSQEINEYANQLITSPTAYNQFANQTIESCMRRMEGKDVEFFNYADENEHYNVSTWAKNEGGDVRLRTGHIIDPSKHSYYGVGMRFVGEGDDSYFLGDRVRSLYGENVTNLGIRTACGGQITGQEASTTPTAPTSSPASATIAPEQAPSAPASPTSTPVAPAAPVTPTDDSTITPTSDPVVPSDNPITPSDDTTTPDDTTPDDTTPPEPEPQPEPEPEPVAHTPKNTEAEIRNAGEYASPMDLDENVTPETTLEQDQEGFDAISQQREEDAARAAEAERIRAEQAAAQNDAAEQAARNQAAREAAEAEQQSQLTEQERQAREAAEAEARQRANEAAARAQAEAAEQQRAAAAAEQQRAAEQAAREAAQAEANARAATESAAAASQAGASASDRAAMFESITNGGE